MQQKERFWYAKKVTIISAVTNAALGVIKIIGGFVFHSHALAADGVHSFSDLLTDGMVYLASKYGSQDADADHPYGHQRIETAAVLLLSLLLIIVGLEIAWDSIAKLFQPHPYLPSKFALLIAALSLIINEGLFHYTKYIGNKIKSDLIITNAWHHRSDAASSAVVFIGILGTMAGYFFLDTIAAIIVSILIIKLGWRYGWSSIKELIDTAVAPEMLKKIEDIILQVDGVIKIHQLRSRMMGPDTFIDVHIQVSPMITVSEGHFIAQHVHQALMTALENIKDVTVHVDPEDDEISSPSLHLPKRKLLEQTLLQPLQGVYPDIEFWTMHYLDGRIIIELHCNQEFKQWQTLKNQIEQMPVFQSDIMEIRLYSLHK